MCSSCVYTYSFAERALLESTVYMVLFTNGKTKNARQLKAAMHASKASKQARIQRSEACLDVSALGRFITLAGVVVLRANMFEVVL